MTAADWVIRSTTPGAVVGAVVVDGTRPSGASAFIALRQRPPSRSVARRDLTYLRTRLASQCGASGRLTGVWACGCLLVMRAGNVGRRRGVGAMNPDLEVLQAPQAVVDQWPGCHDFEPAYLVRQAFEKGRHFHAGKGHADAGVLAPAKRELVGWSASDVEACRVGVLALVPVGRAV